MLSERSNSVQVCRTDAQSLSSTLFDDKKVTREKLILKKIRLLLSSALHKSRLEIWLK